MCIRDSAQQVQRDAEQRAEHGHGESGKREQARLLERRVGLLLAAHDVGAHIVEHGQRCQRQQHERNVTVGRQQLAGEEVDHGQMCIRDSLVAQLGEDAAHEAVHAVGLAVHDTGLRCV